MAVKDINLELGREIEGINNEMAQVKSMIEDELNLQRYTDNVQPVKLNLSTIMRICLLVSLSDSGERDVQAIAKIIPSKNNSPFPTGFFTRMNIKPLILMLMHLRYHDVELEWTAQNVTKALGYEMLRGRDMLLQPGALNDWLSFVPQNGAGGSGDIPEIVLNLGKYDNGNDAMLDLNARKIPNAQIVIAGSTGSGKTNLLAVLISQLRAVTTDTAYPVNFLLFDYKGEFSDPAHSSWLDDFAVADSAILNPLQQPLPFNPFKNMQGKTINEINLYATTLSTALTSIFGARVSATMDNDLREAINKAYADNQGKPISFAQILKNYNDARPDRNDTIVNSLRQLVDAHIFQTDDDIDLIGNSFIINLGQYPKDGPIAKAIVYFTVSKLNAIYDSLPEQEKNDERVQLRHFTIIDEAHYMLGFKNEPLKHLIAVGRNKGMSIILATQSMDTFKNDYFDFYANAYYPIIMKQQTINSSILSGLFGTSARETAEVKQVVSDLQLGELIIKDNDSAKLGLGKRYKKIKVTHLI